jgi:hypothetical protein
MNEQNLIPTTKLTEKERRELASKAGKASVEARRKKRDLRRAIEILLETDIKDEDGNVKSGAEALAIAQFKKALKGDTRAFEVLRDTSGQSVVQRVQVAEVDQDVINDVERAVFDMEEDSKPAKKSRKKKSE